MESPRKKVNQNQVNSDYQWLMMQSLSKYKGQWIAVSEKKIIARNESLKKVQDKVNSLNLQNIPFYLRVPESLINSLALNNSRYNFVKELGWNKF